MIKPNKYTDINLSIVGLSAEILQQLNNEPTLKYSRLENRIVRKFGKSAKENFLLALLFLFSVGKIRYYDKEDAIEFLQDKK